MASQLVTMATLLVTMAIPLVTMAIKLVTMVTHLVTMGTTLVTMATKLLTMAKNLVTMVTMAITTVTHLVHLGDAVLILILRCGRCCHDGTLVVGQLILRLGPGGLHHFYVTNARLKDMERVTRSHKHQHLVVFLVC